MTDVNPIAPASVFSSGKKIFYPAFSVYQRAAVEFLDLWQDQISHMREHLTCFQKIREAAEPAFSFYTQGMNLWLGWAEASFGGPSAPASAPVPLALPAPKQVRQKRAPKAKASRESLPGEAVLEDLARRVAEMEREREGLQTASVIGFEEAAQRRQNKV